LSQSPTHEVLVEESVLGWKDTSSRSFATGRNFIVVCSIENLDPMGVHTATRSRWRAMTLTDREFQRLRNARAPS